jgi:hyperosmotically inducible protein
MKTLSTRILRFAQVGLFGFFTAQAAFAAEPAADFAQYDVNKDGVVSLEEFAARGGKAEAFRAGDANGDGVLNEDEFAKAKGSPGRADAGKYLDDAWITAKVKTALLKEAKLKSLDVGVETEKGTVVLSGGVASELQRQQAERIAAGVEGVKSVRNDLRLKGQAG